MLLQGRSGTVMMVVIGAMVMFMAATVANADKGATTEEPGTVF